MPEAKLKRAGILIAFLVPLIVAADSSSNAPLKFLQAVVMPDVPKGPYSDH